MQTKGDKFVYDHKLRSTHDIPCGCEIKVTVDAGLAIQKYLVGVVENGDPLVMHRANGWLYDQIYSDRGSSKQLEKKKKGKGRSKGSKNKSREQVYTQWDFRQSNGPPQDVLGDGNCGFHVMASHLFGSEHQWHNARIIGANELEERPDLYDFFFERDIPKHVHRIRWGPNGPLTGPVREIAIARLGDYKHYIQLDFVVSDFPVPSIPYQWFRQRDTFVIGWEQPYLKRIELWHTSCNDNGRTQSPQSSSFNVE
ncbi:OLC1v1006211C1 [Oldenlandia corymbosa var. corymbosa]|uniref:OLC1v1006211C1 n=1 Tax=Oldenlandia corymbosa var. corymbosa TaxID=529605 RepID=A0AAV1DIZ8_OLDCO|nr:OLC1v1006211C1 [Oldenlandia corymbosa var. corymbosa]